MTSGQEPLSFGAVNSNLPPLCNTPATFLINPSWTSGSSKKKSPQATTPSKVRAKKSESSTAAHSTGTLGKRARNAATIVGEASTPYTLNPRSIKACEIGTRSEEHTSELQSRRDLVCRLLLEKKKSLTTGKNNYTTIKK